MSSAPTLCPRAEGARLYFKPIREPREGYFAEYQPPCSGSRLAMLTLVFLEPMTPEDTAAIMERELEEWLDRYPVPLMITAFSPDESMVSLASVRPSNHLVGFVSDGDMRCEWGVVPDNELPDIPSDALHKIFQDVHFETQTEINKRFANETREIRRGKRNLWRLLFLWLVLIPGAVAIVGWASPFWGIVVLLYALGMSLLAALKLSGWLRPSRKKQREAQELAEMRHYYYHCKRNPEGFLRLKDENFKRDAEEKTRQEAEALGMHPAQHGESSGENI